jgi:general secretion pathway protein G
VRQGFTLIELVLVVAIIAILAGAMVPVIQASRTEAREAKALAEVDAMKSAGTLYRADTGNWCTDLNRLVSDGTPAIPGWQGPYIDQIGTDPWNQAYALKTVGTIIYLQSLGADGDDDNCSPSPPASPGANGDLCVVYHN